MCLELFLCNVHCVWTLAVKLGLSVICLIVQQFQKCIDMCQQVSAIFGRLAEMNHYEPNFCWLTIIKKIIIPYQSLSTMEKITFKTG